MKRFELTVLGNNSAIPAHGRHPSAQYLTIGNEHILIDCGEGAQMQIRRYGLKAFPISHIFISHLHGDHYLGLIGLLNSLSLNRRTKPLHIYAHIALRPILEAHVRASGFQFLYPLHFHVLPEKGSGRLMESKQFTADFFQLDHRIACTGLRMTEKLGKKRLQINLMEQYKISQEFWNEIQLGADFELADGRVIKNEELTIPHEPARSYCYCSDTKYNETVIEAIQNSTMAYIESTYTKAEQHLAKERYHCTSIDAAKMAKQANVNQLLLGHFSSRYKHLSIFQEEAKEVFKNTMLAVEGDKIELG